MIRSYFVVKACCIFTLVVLAIELVAASATGSGCVIGREYVLTAAHVVKDAKKIEVRFHDGRICSANWVTGDSVGDWAVLKVDQPAERCVCIADNCVELGASIYVLGFPTSEILGSNIKYTDGSVSSTTGMVGDKGNFQFSAPIQPGNSGGPIFDTNGKLVGIVLATLNAAAFMKASGGSLPQNVNFGLHINEIRSRLEKYISASSTDDCSVQLNQVATCFITVEYDDEKVADVRPVTGATVKRQEYDRSWYKDRSPRFKMIADNLIRFMQGEFVMPDGEIVRPVSDASFNKCFNAFERYEEVIDIEIDKYCTSVDFLANLTKLEARAYNALVDKYCETFGSATNKISTNKYFGFMLGQQVSRYNKIGELKKELFGVDVLGLRMPDGKSVLGNSCLHILVDADNYILGIVYASDAFCDKVRAEKDANVMRLAMEKKFNIKFKRATSWVPWGKYSLHNATANGKLDWNIYQPWTRDARVYYYMNDGVSIVVWANFQRDIAGVLTAERKEYSCWVAVSYSDLLSKVVECRERNIKSSTTTNLSKEDIDAL